MSEPCALVGGLTKAICCTSIPLPRLHPLTQGIPDINRLLHPAQPLSSPEDSANLPDPRILILSVSPDASNSYIPVMNSIFSAQKLVSPSPLLLRSSLTSPSLHPENHDRRLQDLRSRFRLPPTSRVPNRRFLHLSRAPRSPTPVPHRTSLPLLCTSVPAHKRVPDDFLAYALDSQSHHRPNGRQDGLPGCLLLPQTSCGRWIRLFRLSFQFSTFDCTPTYLGLISSPVFCQPVPVCSTCR